ncbi:MAG TPA: pyruvate kinase [Candidatus Binatia bacterium]|nr:pyruvate kinase [Candidatus Binatia bacterium]
MTRTRIVVTVGPATRSEAALGAFLDAGVDVFRLNFAHGTAAEHGEVIAAIRRLAAGRPAAIVQDLAGPKLRLVEAVRGAPGDVVPLTLPPTVQAGDPVLLADGLMQLEVVDPLHARVVVGGDIPAGKGINLPSSRLDIPSLTPKDEADLRFGVAHGVDFVALSFVRRAADLDGVKRAGVPVIAKIEKAEAVSRIDEIVAAADAVMVARGDLGVEVPIERVPVVQKQLIALANRAAKPVITATQMLRSMVESPLPTRAEATDVANAVLDGTDAVMLSEETAVGRYPLDAVRVMERILQAAEAILRPRSPDPGDDVPAMIALEACRMAERTRAGAIVVPTRTGASARRVARHRPGVPVIALTPDETVRRRLSLVWGVTTLTLPWFADTDALLAGFRAPVRATGLVAAGAPVVVTGGWPFADPSSTNLVHVTVL